MQKKVRSEKWKLVVRSDAAEPQFQILFDFCSARHCSNEFDTALAYRKNSEFQIQQLETKKLRNKNCGSNFEKLEIRN